VWEGLPAETRMKSAHKLGWRKLPTGFQIEYRRSREFFWSTATVKTPVERFRSISVE
jgi:hypothetical protein